MSQLPPYGLNEIEAPAMDHALGCGSRAERNAAELRLLSAPRIPCGRCTLVDAPDAAG